jgi:Flp pilus assembly pilin Flp
MVVMDWFQYYRAWAADRAAVTALEYGIVAAFFAVLLLGIFGRFGTALSTLYTVVTSGI